MDSGYESHPTTPHQQQEVTAQASKPGPLSQNHASPLGPAIQQKKQEKPGPLYVESQRQNRALAHETMDDFILKVQVMRSNTSLQPIMKLHGTQHANISSLYAGTQHRNQTQVHTTIRKFIHDIRSNILPADSSIRPAMIQEERGHYYAGSSIRDQAEVPAVMKAFALKRKENSLSKEFQVPFG